MTKVHYIITMAVLLVSTALFTSFVFIPTISPYEVVNVETIQENETSEENPEEEPLPTLLDLLSLEKDTTKVVQAEILNRDIPQNWEGKEIFFRYTYIGEYDQEAQSKLDDLLITEYRWQKQLDEKGNVVMGGIVLYKDGTYQLHTHNTFTKGNKYFLLGDLLDRYHSNGNLVDTEIQFGSVKLVCIWEKDTKIMVDNVVPYADLIISTCLERYGDRRLISGWNIVLD